MQRPSRTRAAGVTPRRAALGMFCLAALALVVLCAAARLDVSSGATALSRGVEAGATLTAGPAADAATVVKAVAVAEPGARTPPSVRSAVRVSGAGWLLAAAFVGALLAAHRARPPWRAPGRLVCTTCAPPALLPPHRGPPRR